MKPHVFLVLASFTGLAAAENSPPPDGASLYSLNCAACHMLDQSVVGPSLVEIRSLYLNKPDDFVRWAVAPGKKRPGAVDMPSMVHVGEPGLRAIHAHMMNLAKGVKEKKVAQGDKFAASPTQTVRPLVQRIFLPNSGPAAIAVALDDKVSLCWDAGECRFRYAWTGGFLDGYPYWKGNGSSLAKIAGTVRFTQTKPLLADAKPKFEGYDIAGGLPTFRYQLSRADDHLEFAESVHPISGGDGFEQSFVISPAPKQPLTLTFTEDAKTKITSDAGNWSKNQLTLTPAQAAKFTLTYKFQ